MKILLVVFSLFYSLNLLASDSITCDELNNIYIDKYVDDFSIHQDSFEINSLILEPFSCETPNKNFILARAIHDLDSLKPQTETDPDFYRIVSEVLNLPGTSLRYISKLSNRPEATASTFVDGDLASIFILDTFVNSSERIRPTYTIVHEARHTIRGEPGHLKCTRGKHKGKDVCDLRLGKEELLVYGSGNSFEFLFLLYLRSHPEATAVMKEEAQSQLNYLATHMFNELEPGILDYYQIQLEN